MAIGERIRFFRNLRGMTQKYLGQCVGFSEKTADVRMAQYESGTRTPKDDMIKYLSALFSVSPEALKVPNIDTAVGVMHTLFAIEDIYGLTVEKEGGQITLHSTHPVGSIDIFPDIITWAEMNSKYRAGEISKEEYDRWRYHFPNNTAGWVKVPPDLSSDI